MENKTRTWFIYSISDPRTMEIRYVGWSFNVQRRIAAHVRRANTESTHKANWLKSLSRDGLSPVLSILEEGSGDWADCEKKWIRIYREEGHPLTNLTEGGEGCVGLVFSTESRKRMADAKRGRKHTEQSLANMRAASAKNIGKKRPPDVVARAVASRAGYTHSDETKKKISESVKGFKHTPEAIKKIADAGRGRTHTEETKEKLRAKRIGKPLTEEHRKKLSEAKKGKRLTEEHKASIRAGHAGGWHHTQEAKDKISMSKKKLLG